MRLGVLCVLVLVITACEPVQPCDDYVDYMCSCHAGGEQGSADDTGVDCQELTLTYQGADPDVQDECAVLLDEQQQKDDEAGATCTM